MVDGEEWYNDGDNDGLGCDSDDEWDDEIDMKCLDYWLIKSFLIDKISKRF